MYHNHPKPRSHSYKPKPNRSSYSKLMKEHQDLQIRLYKLSECNSQIFSSGRSVLSSRYNSPVSPALSWMSDRMNSLSPILTPDIHSISQRVVTTSTNCTSPKLHLKTRALGIKPRSKIFKRHCDREDAYLSSPSSSDDSIPDENTIYSHSSSDSSYETTNHKEYTSRKHRAIAHVPYQFPQSYMPHGMIYNVYPQIPAYLPQYPYPNPYYNYYQPPARPRLSKVDASIQCDTMDKQDSFCLKTPKTTAKSSMKSSELKPINNEKLLEVQSELDISNKFEKKTLSYEPVRPSLSIEQTQQDISKSQICKSSPWAMEIKLDNSQPQANQRHLKMLERFNSRRNQDSNKRQEKSKQELIEIRKEMLKPKQDKVIEISVTHNLASIPTKLLARLSAGERSKISRKEMLSLTRRNYMNLPEVKKKLDDERKRLEHKQRLAQGNAYKSKLKLDRIRKREASSAERSIYTLDKEESLPVI